MTANSEAASERSPDADLVGESGGLDAEATERTELGFPTGWRHTLTWAAVATLAGAMAAVMFATHKDGHWWGDDWALYINQAQSLMRGEPSAVTDSNLFTVENSQGAAFSPPLYPWGFPIILAPFTVLFGRDVDQLAMVPVLCSAVFAVSWFLLARRRIGVIPALIGMVAVTLSPLLLSWSELIQSEWPFLAVSGAALVGIDRLAADDTFVDLGQRWWPLVVVGLAATATFTVRREGLAVVAAIAAAQLAALIAADRGWWSVPESRKRMAARLLTPHLSALASVYVLQIVLPSTLVPQYSGTSVANVWRFRTRLIENVAEVSGLKKSFEDDPAIFGSTTWGWIAVVAYFVFAVAGIVFALVMYRRRDLHLVGYVVAALLIGGSFRSPINRYVVSLGPILLLLGVSALVTIVSLVPWRAAPPLVASLVFAAIAVGNGFYVEAKLDSARRFEAAEGVEWGPTHPDALAMYNAVLDLTEPDDVVASPKARAMSLITERPAVQVDQYRPLPDHVDIGLVVVLRESPLIAELDESDHYQRAWEQGRFVLYRPVS